MLSALKKIGTWHLKLYIYNWYTLLNVMCLSSPLVKPFSEQSFSSATVKENQCNLSNMPNACTSLLLWCPKWGWYVFLMFHSYKFQWCLQNRDNDTSLPCSVCKVRLCWRLQASTALKLQPCINANIQCVLHERQIWWNFILDDVN